MSHSRFLPVICLPILVLVPRAVPAAQINQCVSPTGSVSFSDQPCPEGYRTRTLTLQGQPRIDRDGAPVANGSGPQPAASPEATPQAEDPALVKARTDQLRRLDFLTGQLANLLGQSVNDCGIADTGLRQWLGGPGREADALWPVWTALQAAEAPPASEEQAALVDLVRSKLRDVRSEGLTRLTARCWDHKPLGDTIDAIRARLPDHPR